MRKPLAAALLAAAAVAALAVPAGASTPATWTHWSQPCAAGGKSATLVSKWVGDTIVKSWYDNPCRNQWLGLIYCQPDSQSDCHTDVYGPKHKGQLGPGAWGATLMNTRNG